MLRDLESKSLAKKSHRAARLQAAAVCERPPRILIIEDELLIALMIEEMVREIGYRVSGVAHTMAMAGQELAKRNYDAVLLDFNIDGRYHTATRWYPCCRNPSRPSIFVPCSRTWSVRDRSLTRMEFNRSVELYAS